MSEHVSQSPTASQDHEASLRSADADYRAAQAEIEEYGESTVEQVADAYDRATSLLDRYAGQATGTGRSNFEKFVEFKANFESLVEDLDDDLPERSAFEAAWDRIDKNRLNERDFEEARSDLEPAGDVAGLLDDRREARERYRQARREIRNEIVDLEDEIADRERLVELGEADLDAPVEEIREPIDAYDDAVSEAFDGFRREESARTVLDFVATVADDYPLVDYRQPPDTLREYVEQADAGTEPIPDLLEYARYSNSKLEHYVDDAGALKRAVATNETYLERLDAGPLEVDWPPRPATELRWRLRELVSVVGRFADDDVVETLRAVQRVVRDEERFERLRTAAEADEQLAGDERERVASGAVASELADLRERKERMEELLDEYPER